MKRSLEQVLAEGLHRLVDELMQLVPEHGLPLSTNVNCYFHDDTIVGYDFKVTDTSVERNEIDYSEDEEMTRERVQGIVEQVLRERGLITE